MKLHSRMLRFHLCISSVSGLWSLQEVFLLPVARATTLISRLFAAKLICFRGRFGVYKIQSISESYQGSMWSRTGIMWPLQSLSPLEESSLHRICVQVDFSQLCSGHTHYSVISFPPRSRHWSVLFLTSTPLSGFHFFTPPKMITQSLPFPKC